MKDGLTQLYRRLRPQPHDDAHDVTVALEARTAQLADRDALEARCSTQAARLAEAERLLRMIRMSSVFREPSEPLRRIDAFLAPTWHYDDILYAESSDNDESDHDGRCEWWDGGACTCRDSSVNEE